MPTDPIDESMLSIIREELTGFLISQVIHKRRESSSVSSWPPWPNSCQLVWLTFGYEAQKNSDLDGIVR